MKRSNENQEPPIRHNFKTKTKGKAGCSKKKKSTKVNEPKRPSILDILKNEDDCNCEIVARAVRSNVHTNLGLKENRLKQSKDLDLKVLK